MKLSERKISEFFQSILSNYIGVGIEPGFRNNLYNNICEVLDNGRYHFKNGTFYGEIPGVYKLLIMVDKDIIEYKKYIETNSKYKLECSHGAKLLSLSNGGCYVEYTSKEINMEPNMLDDSSSDIFDHYEQVNTKNAFLLSSFNDLKINYMETMKYNYNKNKLTDETIISSPTKNKNYSEKTYSYLSGENTLMHIVKKYLYPDEIIEFFGLSDVDSYINSNNCDGVKYRPTESEKTIYKELEDEINNIMYNEVVNKIKIKK